LILPVDRIGEVLVLLRFTNAGEVRVRRESDFVLVRNQVLVSQVRKKTMGITVPYQES